MTCLIPVDLQAMQLPQRQTSERVEDERFTSAEEVGPRVRFLSYNLNLLPRYDLFL